jgi:hypothetical protein
MFDSMNHASVASPSFILGHSMAGTAMLFANVA